MLQFLRFFNKNIKRVADRSWARRARSGSNSRKRPELLNIDFSEDRERPVSPAPPPVERSNTPSKDETRSESRPRYFFFHFHQQFSQLD